MYEPVEVTARRKRRAIIVAVVVVIAAIAAVMGVGGLAPRDTRAIVVQPGEEIDQGMMVFTLSSATVAYVHAQNEWDVIVTGKVRNPTSETLRPTSVIDHSIIGIDRATEQYLDPVCSLGEVTSDWFMSERKMVPPNSEWMDIRMLFTLEDPYEPSDTFVVGFRPMVYKVLAAYGYSSAEGWAADASAQSHVVNVPLTRLPDQ